MEIENLPQNYNRSVLTINSFLSRRKDLTFSNDWIILLVGDYPVKQLVPCEQDFGWMVLWERDPESSDRFFDGLCDMEGKSLRQKASMMREGGHCPYTLAFTFLRKSRENLSQGSRLVRDYSLRRLGRLLRDSFGWPAEHQSTSVTRG
jgi:hypothetical protein